MSEINAIEVPKWGLSMEEGTVTVWRVSEGTSFRKGDLLCEVETSKITNELEAPFDGLLRRIVAQPGETLPVGGVLAVSAAETVSDAEIEEFLSSRRATPVPAEVTAPAEADAPEAAATPAAAPAPKPGTSSGSTLVPESLQGETSGEVFVTPHALKLAEKLTIDLGKITGTGRAGRVSVEDVHAAVRSAGGSIAAPAPPDRPKMPGRTLQDDSEVDATPVARRLAGNLGINLHDCRATGSRGRVCEADVREAERKFGLVTTSAEASSDAETPVEFETVAFDSMRKAIGQRLQASKRGAPHFRLTADLEIDDLLALRKQINATVPSVKLSVNDFIVKACGAALLRVPEVNVQFDEQTQLVRRYTHADVSVAVALPSGLITPIVRKTDTRSLASVSEEVHSLVTKAKSGTLAPEEFQGGTFTVSNLGMHGVRAFDAIINPPQVAILAVGAGTQRPVVANGEVVPRTVLTVTLSCDHRVIDGALGASFLAELKRFVESPALMLV
ncbi:diaminohydroxyphosphoribosylaminopyrimidine deaminase [Saccharopolyspora karakumensis]|uniref:Dihydrolipoamide acetyltransferase component of pyruvate dehydrogenase complex n=1 Tax=Saccharopolyspora karakumensis TaxID=2530386 RepID=A0A4R5BUK5_9PSEU|nr:2-oxo acid dehydrogenase subunit E2 [Saccharopolyspora karakumensis]TDD89213.1 diaminohydroxyphosphoribosylaminopyrimidine deaminase [Saccharopolyspora karakumensis]